MSVAAIEVDEIDIVEMLMYQSEEIDEVPLSPTDMMEEDDAADAEEEEDEVEDEDEDDTAEVGDDTTNLNVYARARDTSSLKRVAVGYHK